MKLFALFAFLVSSLALSQGLSELDPPAPKIPDLVVIQVDTEAEEGTSSETMIPVFEVENKEDILVSDKAAIDIIQAAIKSKKKIDQKKLKKVEFSPEQELNDVSSRPQWYYYYNRYHTNYYYNHSYNFFRYYNYHYSYRASYNWSSRYYYYFYWY